MILREIDTNVGEVRKKSPTFFQIPLTFSLATFGALQLSVVPTGISPIQQQALWQLQGQEVLVNAPVGTVSALYSLNGQLVSTHVQRSAQFETVGAVPTNGLYVLRVKDKSTKIFVR